MTRHLFPFLAFLLAAPAGAQQVGASSAPLTGPQLKAITKTVVAPMLYVTGWSQAAVKARLELCRQLRERYPQKLPPDKDLVRVCLRLTLRLNNSWLQGMGGKRAYPGTEDFDRFADSALAALQKYSAGLPEEHVWGPNDDTAAQDILDRELRLGLGRLPYCGAKPCAREPEPSPEELKYLPARGTPRRTR
ncbi:MAG: hypothetical protein M0025_00840 [Elusimicrobia bacterium]|nr:hypothetical protein [Elusimicrobiota bacterium]